MDKKKIKIIIGCILLIGIIITIIVFHGYEETPPKPINKNKSFTKVYDRSYEGRKFTSGRVYQSIEDFEEDFYAPLTSTDFRNHNYVLVVVRVDPCSEENVTPTSYKRGENNHYVVTFTYNSTCGICSPEDIYYVLEVPNSVEEATVEVQNKINHKEACDPNVAYKPMIYLYPEEETEVEVVLGHKEFLTSTYPKYKDSWKVTAFPDGTLKENNRTYYGLYWEGMNHQTTQKEEGFVVNKKELIPFLEEKLEILGLREKEANEFIVYWLPILEENEWNYIRFETIEEINQYMPLTITPKPDTMIRIMMDSKPLKEPIQVQEQKLKPVERKGFTVVEWGGSILAK